MKEYNYNDIKKITKLGIIFKDEFELFFEECRKEWAMENNIKGDEVYCVAKRDSLAKPPYFLFYSKERVKVIFDRKGFFCKKKNRDEFQYLQVILNRYGFSSYDMT